MARNNRNTVEIDETADLEATEATAGTANEPSDDEFVVNLAEVKTGGFEPVPAGTYDVVVSKVVNARSKSGSPKKIVHFEIEHDADGDEEYAGRKIFNDFSFHPNAMWMTKQKLTACGVPEDHSGPIPNDMLLGARLRLTVNITTPSGISERTGKPYAPNNEITAWLPYGGGGTDIDSVLG